uniref:Uncharacterized protein n=1 Tax=Bosea sp. NBC_00436 TaxID=2969620 RepID=A0A9E7ZUY5_9HYPH
MKKLSRTLTYLLLAGSLLAPAVQAQPAPPPAPAVRERAPGVPIAPQPGAVSRLRTEEKGLFRREGRMARDAQAAQGADRELPMPRGVPSIIAP